MPVQAERSDFPDVPTPPSTLALRPTAGQILLVATVYVAAWGGLLASADAVYWDDWTVFDATLQETRAAATESGLVWGFVLGLLSRGGPIPISLLMFLALLVASLLALSLLSRIPFLSRSEATFGAAVFAAAPLVAARNSAVLVMYVLSLMAVLLVWDLLIRPGPIRGRTVLAALPPILLASLVPSAGLFLLVPVGHVLMLRRGELRRPVALSVILLASLLPAIQIIASRVYLPAHGAYEGYNEISFALLGLMLIVTGVAATGAGLLFALLRDRSGAPEFGFVVIAVGVTLALVALTPYVAVGQLPPYDEWSTRHELLLPIGVSVVAVGAARLLVALGSRRLVLAAMTVTTLALVSQSAAISLAYLRDWEKQEELVSLFRDEAAIRFADVVLFADETREQNLFERYYRAYEWNGLMVRAFGDSRRAAVLSPEVIPALLDREARTAAGDTALYLGDREFDAQQAATLARVTVVVDPAAPSGVALTSVLEPLHDGPTG